MTRGPARDGQVHVLADKCSTCVFRPGNLMRLAPGRLRDLVTGNVEADSALVCHATLDYAPGDAPPAICRGFWDAYADRVWTLRLAAALQLVTEDPVPE